MKKAFAASVLAAVLTVPVLISPASAADTVQRPRTIEAFTGTNLVDVQNYPANKRITIEVLRRGVVVSSVAGRTDADGFAEFNHVGGGQVPRGDCFKPPVSPDIVPGDVIRTTTQGDRPGVKDRATVRNLSIDFASIAVNPAGTITVSGTVNSTAAAPIRPGTDILELRLNKGNPADPWDTGPGLDQDRPGRKDLRVDIGANVTPDGSWTRTLNVGAQDAADWQATPGEVTLEWSRPAANFPPAIFVADQGDGNLPGCPAMADNAVTKSSPKAVNKANMARGLALSGIAKDATAASITLDDQDASAADRVVLTGALKNAFTDDQGQTFKSWKTGKATAAQLAKLRDGRLTATGSYTLAGGATVNGVNLSIVKDTVAPKSPTATPRPGVYPRPQVVTLVAQRGATIHYTLNGTNPTLASKVFNRPVRIASTKTLKAIAVDKAGNRSPVGAYRYVIR